MNYDIYWLPTQQSGFAQSCPFVNILAGTYIPPSTPWPNGYYVVAQGLTFEQFTQVDNDANNHVCLDVKPASTPPQSPTGR